MVFLSVGDPPLLLVERPSTGTKMAADLGQIRCFLKQLGLPEAFKLPH
jgi:hypothetical protein